MAFDGRETESARLRKDVEWALRRALDPTDVLPMLHRLARTAEVGTDESVFAHRQLAELIAPRHPWRAALYARRVLGLRPHDDRAWAVLAFAQTLLGHYRYAATAYARALGCAPKNPWYAHNLGHLLDVALGRSKEALPWLASAYAAAKDHGELATSYAHALARSGDLATAKRVLGRAMRRERGAPSREQAALWRWLERGAPAPKRAWSQTGEPAGAQTDKSVNVPTYIDAEDHDETRPTRRRTASVLAESGPAESALERALASGLDHLPLDARQRVRAKAIAHDLATRRRPGHAPDAPDAKDASVTAAAIAFAIVDLDEVPLTQAEVAACFRIRVASLRARYEELRAELLLLGAGANVRARVRMSLFQEAGQEAGQKAEQKTEQKAEKVEKTGRRRAAVSASPSTGRKVKK